MTGPLGSSLSPEKNILRKLARDAGMREHSYSSSGQLDQLQLVLCPVDQMYLVQSTRCTWRVVPTSSALPLCPAMVAFFNRFADKIAFPRLKGMRAYVNTPSGTAQQECESFYDGCTSFTLTHMTVLLAVLKRQSSRSREHFLCAPHNGRLPGNG